MIDNLFAVFNRLPPPHISSSEFTVKESDSGATTKELHIDVGCELIQFGSEIFSGSSLPSSYMDKNCDGVAITKGDGGMTRMILAELKSDFSVNTIEKALTQTVVSLVKICAWLFMCDGFSPDNLNVHIIIACQTFKDGDAEADFLQRVNDSRTSGTRPLYGVLYGLTDGKPRKISLREVLSLCKSKCDIPLNGSMLDKVYIRIVRSQSYNEPVVRCKL